jgi:hypothetical protein
MTHPGRLFADVLALKQQQWSLREIKQRLLCATRRSDGRSPDEHAIGAAHAARLTSNRDSGTLP